MSHVPDDLPTTPQAHLFLFSRNPSPNMKFQIDHSIFDSFPGLNIGVVIAKGIDNSTSTPTEILELINKRQAEVRQQYQAETLSQHPKIELWRKAYSKFGGKPKENRSSVENLHRMILKGTDLRSINPLVDIYNLISLSHLLPCGGEDLNKMQGDLVLTFAGPAEVPVHLLGEKDARAPHEGEVIYKDSVSTICRRWNWREADRTKLTKETKNSILVIEGLPPVTRTEIESATLELAALVEKYCGGHLSHSVLDSAKPFCDL